METERQTTIQRVEQQLCKAIEAGIKAGWKLTQGTIQSSDKRCCAVGMVVCDLKRGVSGSTIFYAEAAERLGIQVAELAAIARGFDDVFGQEILPEFYDLGVRLRERYLPKEK